MAPAEILFTENSIPFQFTFMALSEVSAVV